ncbi:MAG TPA: KpsF/GutQ family sugar-phosphate isomerase [Gemmatimonadales bacterium]|nr:KpsF/GutQ family sugar-phosphate isomerase [Gemmatimonadales bacterium]
MPGPSPAEIGRRVIRLEAAELSRTAERLGESFGAAVELLAAARGRVIVSGVGKSGLIARKIAATLTSTGTPATYLHPVDSLHGDLGMVGRDDVAIVLSKSGESDELAGLLAALERLAVPVIAITGGEQSMLSRLARVTLDGSVTEEACPHDLAPTTSTTVALALGDALAVALMEVKGFRRDDFAALHPGGALGRKLLLKVRDVMIPAQPLQASVTMRDVILALAHQRGLAILVEHDRLAGVLSAGDLSRLAGAKSELLQLKAADVMTRTPRTAAPDDLAASAVGKMERFGIMALPVVDAEGRVAGVVHLHDLMRAGAV